MKEFSPIWAFIATVLLVGRSVGWLAVVPLDEINYLHLLQYNHQESAPRNSQLNQSFIREFSRLFLDMSQGSVHRDLREVRNVNKKQLLKLHTD